MATLDKVNTAISAPVQKQTSWLEWISASMKDVRQMLPQGMHPERLERIFLTCLRLNPELTKCTPLSLKGALFLSAQTGLEPMGGQAFILPFRNKGVLEAQFIIGYRGAVQLFYRNEKSIELSWGVVKEGDFFEYCYGSDPYLRHREAAERGETIGFYVCSKIQGGGRPFRYMSKEACMAHGRKHSKTFDVKTQQFSRFSPWFTDPDSMCLKTVLIQLAKLLPLSIETQRSLMADESIRDFNPHVESALDLPDKMDWQEKETKQETNQEAKQEADKGTEKKDTENYPELKGDLLAAGIIKTTAPEDSELARGVKSEPSAALNVLDALKQPVGAAFDVWGILFDFKTIKTKTGKDMTFYKINARGSTDLMDVSLFGPARTEIIPGNVLKFTGVKVSLFNEAKTYLAQAMEVLPER